MRRATVEIVVDEAKTKDYLICAVVAPSEDPAAARTTMRALEADQPPAGCTAATSARRIGGGSWRPSPAHRKIRQAHLFTAPIAGRPHRQVPGRLLAALAVHSAELGARRILVESCAQDAQDLAACTGALAHIGAPTTVRARADRRHAHELRWGGDLIAYADTAGGQLRRAIDSPVTAARVP
ncbi:hypothetical protein [Rhodococcus ruber]